MDPRIASVFEEERAWLKAWRAWAAALLLAALVASIVWALGGFATATRRDLPTIAAGDRLVTDDWILRPLHASLASANAMGRPAPAGGAFLILEAEVENRTRNSRSDVDTALRWVGPSQAAAASPGSAAASSAAVPADAVILLRDPSFGALLHPGIPERIELSWTVPATTPFAATQEWLLMGRKWVAKDRLNGGGNWLNRRALARTRFSVDDVRGRGDASP